MSHDIYGVHSDSLCNAVKKSNAFPADVNKTIYESA